MSIPSYSVRPRRNEDTNWSSNSCNVLTLFFRTFTQNYGVSKILEAWCHKKSIAYNVPFTFIKNSNC